MNKGKDKDQRKEEEEKEGGESKSQKGSVWGAGQDGDWEEEKKQECLSTCWNGSFRSCSS